VEDTRLGSFFSHRSSDLINTSTMQMC
jgi:hypothetical protein